MAEPLLSMRWPTSRQCGSSGNRCTLCCKLLPVRELKKAAGQRCQHQRRDGCRVYGKAAMPVSCKLWHCAWIAQKAGDTRRPDRVHYVIDVLPDYITIRQPTGEETKLPVRQVWIDPDYPDAHRDPALRAWLDETATAAVIRYSSREGIILFPPSVAGDGEWHEVTSGVDEREHTAAEVAAVIKEEVEG